MVTSLRTARLTRLLATAVLAVCTTATSAAALGVRTMPFTANDVVYEKVGGKLYVSVPGNSAVYPNSIVVINPTSGAVEASVWVGSEPNVLALSDDGQYLYVGLDGAAAVRRVYLPTLTPGLQFGLGSDASFGPYLAGSVSVMPGASSTIAVVRIRQGISGTGGVAIYDDGIVRPVATTSTYGAERITFGTDPARLYGIGSGITTLTVSPSGVTLDDEWGIETSCFGRLRFQSGVLQCGARLFDPATLTEPGSLPGNWIRDASIDTASRTSVGVVDRTDLGSRTWLAAFDLDTYRAVWWLPVPEAGSVYYAARVAAFPGGAAVRGDSGALVIVDIRESARLVLSRAGSGFGRVSASPGSMACGEDCARLFSAGTAVTLTATADAGSRFAGWEGDADCADGTVVMDGPRVCVARFERLTKGLGLHVPVPSNDIAYSPLTGKLYASVPGSDPVRGNTITEIDPATGEPGRSVWVGSEPGPLALSDDGATMYVGLTGASSVRRVDLLTGTPLQPFQVGLTDYVIRDRVYAEDLAVPPGDPDSVAIVRRVVGSSGDDGVGIYTNGVMRPLKVDTVYGPRSLAFGDSSARLYGSDIYTSGETFFRMDVGADGVSLAGETRGLTGDPIHYAGGRVFADGGRVVDAETATLVGTLPLSDLIWSRAVAPDLSADVVYAAGSPSYDLVVRKYDPTSFTLRHSVSLGLGMDVVGRLRVAGPNRVALRVGQSSWEGEGIIVFAFDEAVTHQVFLSSSGAPAPVPIEVTPADASGLGAGVTPFGRHFPQGTAVTFTAPASAGSKVFDRWRWGTYDSSTARALTLTLSKGYELVAAYRDPAPTVTAVAPASGPASGGTLVTITGTGFQAGAVAEFGNFYPLTDLVVVSGTTITGRTPALAAGTYSLDVTNPDYQRGALASAFTFANLPGYFAKSGPADLTAGASGVAVLTWTSAAGAARYEYCVDSTVNGACDSTWVSTSAVTRAFAGPLTALVTYEWQVRAVSPGGTTDADGGWWTFTVAADPGCAPGPRTILGKPVTTQGLAGMWQPTGLTAVAGKPVSFLVATGQAWTNGAASWSADGNASDLAPGTNVPLTGAPRMALVGRIGTAGAPFLVGSAYQAPASQGGQIYLAPNDDWYALYDNGGSMAVTVCPGEAPCTLDGAVTAPATAAPGESIAFIAAVTSTGCLNAVSYAWDFGDGTPASAEAAPSHAYSANGTYSWSVTVNSGAQQFVRTGTVLVMEPGSCVPAAKTVQAKPAGGGLAGMWQATGITVGAGDTITLSAEAGQTWTNGGASWAAAGNASDVMQGANCPMPGAPRMALIGRVGATGAPFLVGQQTQVTAPMAGEVFLAPNDDWYMLWDNAGTLTVSLCAGGAACSVDATATVPPAGAAASPVAFAATATATNCAGSPTFEWDFGDGGPASTEQNPAHAYAAGAYTWTLTVRAGSATATRTGSITVTAAGSCVPANTSVLAKPAGGGLAAMWQAAGVTVRAGETLTIGATGQSWTNGGRTWTAAGDAADLVYGQNCPLSGAPRMALIGRMGATGAPFLVGTQKELTAATGGELYLAPNDDWYLLWDNAGTLAVSVCAGPATCRVEAAATAPATATAGTPVSFAGTGTATACAGAAVFEWDFGDGSPVSSAASPSHTYATGGTYTWTLTVRADTATVTRSGSIQVREPGACTTEMRTVLAKPTGGGLAGMWQATGITVALGDVIEFDAAGGQTWTNGGQACSADGDAADVLQGQNCPMPGSGRMALVGRIGERGTPFLVGQHRQITAAAAGQLYLAPNDDWYLLWDNAGSLAVSICR